MNIKDDTVGLTQNHVGYLDALFFFFLSDSTACITCDSKINKKYMDIGIALSAGCLIS